MTLSITEDTAETRPGDDARDYAGRFMPGNQFARGNAGGGRLPHKLTDKLRNLFTEQDLDDIRANVMRIVKDQKSQASAVVNAAKLVCELIGGRPGAAEYLDEIQALKAAEAELRQRVDELTEQRR